MKKFDITTQKEIRKQFWEVHHYYVRHPGWPQNRYPANTRMAFCDYVEYLNRDGQISDALAQRATL